MLRKAIPFISLKAQVTMQWPDRGKQSRGGEAW
jgi:hypothetical protein